LDSTSCSLLFVDLGFNIEFEHLLSLSPVYHAHWTNVTLDHE
jgi:hypothetical protein